MRKFIAGVEIIAGIFVLICFILQLGTGLGLENLYKTEFTLWSFNFNVSVLISLIFGILNIVAGISLWRNKKSGRRLSVITQLIQLISIQTTNFYAYVVSLIGWIYFFNLDGIKSVVWSLGYGYQLSFNPQPVETTFVGINIVALALLISILVSE